jgi:hypothetical protein
LFFKNFRAFSLGKILSGFYLFEPTFSEARLTPRRSVAKPPSGG